MPSKGRWAKMTPEQKDQARERNRKSYRANREKRLATVRKYYRANREKKLEYAREYNREYRASHPQHRARESLAAQEYWASRRERKNETSRSSYHRRKARGEAEWNEITAEIQGASNV